MVNDLEGAYNGETSTFAKDLNSLFQTNKTIAKLPFVTSELYMLLLFEIGRRLVKDPKKSTPMKEKFDKLPIKEAIQGILALLHNKKCEFHQVFLKEGNFHCFSFSPEIRGTAIKEACKELEKAAKKKEKEAKKMEKEAKEMDKAAKEIEEALSTDEEGETESEPIDGSLSLNFKQLSFKEKGVSD